MSDRETFSSVKPRITNHETGNTKRGMALILTFIFMVTLIIIVAAYLFMTTYSTRNLNAQINNVRAFYLAEAGLQKAIWNILTPVPQEGWGKFGAGQSRTEEDSLGGTGTYSVTASRTGNIYTIDSIGAVGSICRSVQQRFTTGGGPGLTPVANSWREI